MPTSNSESTSPTTAGRLSRPPKKSQSLDLARDGIEGIVLPVSGVSEIERAIEKLSRTDLGTFRDWFFAFDAAAWDKQFEQDVRNGRLDALADEAVRDLREGRCTDL